MARSKSLEDSIREAIADFDKAKLNLLEFEEENDDVIGAYREMASEYNKSRKNVEALLRTLPVQGGTKTFGLGFQARLRTKKWFDVKEIVRARPEFLEAHPEAIQSINIGLLAERNPRFIRGCVEAVTELNTGVMERLIEEGKLDNDTVEKSFHIDESYAVYMPPELSLDLK